MKPPDPSPQKIVIFGDSQLASLAHFYFKHDTPHEVVGFTVDQAYVKQPEYENLPMVAFEKVAQHFPPDEYQMFLPISFKRMNYLR